MERYELLLKRNKMLFSFVNDTFWTTSLSIILTLGCFVAYLVHIYYLQVMVALLGYSLALFSSEIYVLHNIRNQEMESILERSQGRNTCACQLVAVVVPIMALAGTLWSIWSVTMSRDHEADFLHRTSLTVMNMCLVTLVMNCCKLIRDRFDSFHLQIETEKQD